MLHTLSPAPGSRHARKRVGRGHSSGHGKTSGRGHKGRQARAGANRNFGFEGGQVPILMRQPKLGGFRQPGRIEYEVINLSTLDKLDAGSYNIAALKSIKVVRSSKPVKILGKGKLSKKLSLSVHAVSASAQEAIEKAGGSVTLVA